VAERGTSSTVVFMPIVASIVAVCCCPQVLPVVMVIGYVIAAIVRDVVWQRHRNTRMAWLQDPDTYLNAMERAAGERGRR
jgi:phosphotransferase system  glucose/maltose/N-acetylglucosamine-specific IIC component